MTITHTLSFSVTDMERIYDNNSRPYLIEKLLKLENEIATDGTLFKFWGSLDLQNQVNLLEVLGLPTIADSEKYVAEELIEGYEWLNMFHSFPALSNGCPVMKVQFRYGHGGEKFENYAEIWYENGKIYGEW